MKKTRLKDILKERKKSFSIEIESESDKHVIDLSDELYFDDTCIKEEIECQAAMVAWYSSNLSLAERNYKQLERRFDVWYAETYNEHSDILTKGTKKPSINAIENSVKKTMEYEVWRTRIDSSKNKVNVLKSVLDWWKEKGVMMVQYVRLLELEYKSDITPRADVEQAQQNESDRLKEKMSSE